jgi:hypothetical protein
MDMTRISPLYEACQRLFATYPLAAKTVNRSGTVRSMVLMLTDGDDAGFFVLVNDSCGGKPSYSLWPWPDGEIVNIEAEGNAMVPDITVDAVTHGVPVPRDGSLFGWTSGDVITALIVIYAEYTLTYPEPGWAIMPLAGIAETEWPPFTGERFFAHWSWQRYCTGEIVSLDGLIAGVPDTVCWVDTKAILGSDCCVVARDITDQDGHTLQRGCYVYYEALRADKPVPLLEVMLTELGKIDLAPRFQRYRHSHGWPERGS